MANAYNYSFGATILKLSGDSKLSQFASIGGSFSVDYSDKNKPVIYNINVRADNQSTSNGIISQNFNSDGTTSYYARFVLFPSMSYTTVVNISYTGQEPEKFSNAMYGISNLESVGSQFFRVVTTYASEEVPVASRPTTNPVCFAAGTRIRVMRDGCAVDVPVERLSIGDVVLTASGQQRPIVWLGHRTIDGTRHPRPEAVWPIRVLPDGFGDGLPSRELWLSPDHAVQVTVLDPVLVPVKHLLNDATIAQVPIAEITYWHVELDSHDVLIAENMPAESFLDTGIRGFFANAGPFIQLHPDVSPLSLDDFCLPLVQDGPIVDAVRTRLIARALALGWSLTSEDDLHVLADGVEVRPERDGAAARFTLSAGARDVRLASRSFVPERVRVGAGDGRQLGVPVRGISVIDRHGVTRALPIDSDLLASGFSFVQDGTWRWTTGNAVLPAILWAGCTESVTLTIETAPDRGTLQAWLAPTVDEAKQAGKNDGRGTRVLAA